MNLVAGDRALDGKQKCVGLDQHARRLSGWKPPDPEPIGLTPPVGGHQGSPQTSSCAPTNVA